ncbi:MAG: thioester reductase domain-containing protein [Kofleriaceae bacterium]
MVRWTPGEAWLMAELARRLLVASLDGEPPIHVGPGFGIEIEASAEQVVLVVTLDARRATLALSPSRIEHQPWRDSWLLEVVRGDTRWMLGTGQPAAEIPHARRGSLRVSLRLAHRVLACELDGDPIAVPLTDVACHRYTRQSSAVPPTGELVAWAAPTALEAAPWWELDLGQTAYVAQLRFDLRKPPAGTRVVVRAYGYVMPSGAPPAGSVVLDIAADCLGDADDAFVTWSAGVVARYLRLELVAPAGTTVALVMTATEAFAATLLDRDLETSLRRAFALHRDRPLIVERADDGTYLPRLTYDAVWSRAMALGRGLARSLEPAASRITLAILLTSRPEWLMADLAGLVRGYVTVPMNPQDPDDQLAIILARANPAVILCEADESLRLARLAPHALVIPLGAAFDAVVADGADRATPALAPRLPADLHSVLFTSGSTGTPKGAMRSYETFFAMISSFALAHSPRHLSFQPLSHLSERMYLPALLLHGGVLAFSRGGAHLLEELRAFEPTTIGTVPRLYEVLHASYQRQLRSALAEEPDIPRAQHEACALATARAAFGTRLIAIAVGSAPVSAEVLAFLRRCFADLWVSEGYGSTEVGTIANDGKVLDTVHVKLVRLPGTVTRPGDPERGEIHVLSPHAIIGYLGDPEATAAAFDADRFFATGDLGERGTDGRVRVIGRVRNTVKLAQGEFVSTERIETALGAAPIVDRIFVYAEHGGRGVAALIVPHAEVLAAALGAASRDLATLVAHPDAARVTAAALQAHGTSLASYEIPRAVLLEPTPFTVEHGLLTASGKLARGALTARYGGSLARLAAGEIDASVCAPTDELVDRVARIAAAVLGHAVDPDQPIAGHAGVDSLAAAEILAALADGLGCEVPLAWWFEARTLAELAIRIGRFSGSGTSAHRERALEDLALPVPTAISAPRRRLKTVLVTGATGFLGARLVESLHARGLATVCLVRAPDDATAQARLDTVLAARGISVATRAIAGDLARPALGLAASFGDQIDAIAHAGATVSWLAPYDALRGANVLGTLAVLELAASRGLPLHHVSTISVAPPDGDETTTLGFDAAVASTPYGLAKWIAEQHVRRAAAAGLPVAIYRPAMIAGDTARGTGNRDDFVNRYLAGCRELGLYVDLETATIDMTPVDFVAEAIAACIANGLVGHTLHLVNVDQSLSYAALGRAMVAAGVKLSPAPYAEFRAALLRDRSSRLAPLAAFFPETCTLDMGPWPCAASLAAIADLGVARPRIDDA